MNKFSWLISILIVELAFYALLVKAVHYSYTKAERSEISIIPYMLFMRFSKPAINNFPIRRGRKFLRLYNLLTLVSNGLIMLTFATLLIIELTSMK